MESQPCGIRVNKFLTQLDSSCLVYIYEVQNINKVNFNSSLKWWSLLQGLTGIAPLSLYLVLHNFVSRFAILSMKHDFCGIIWASLRLLLFFISVFCSLLINMRLVFISYFVSVPLRKGHRGLEYQCSFVPVSFCIFDYLY